MADLSVIILTHDEEIHLGRALDQLRGLAREVIVVDSYSTDATVEIARSRGARVLQHPFENQARQFQWALDNAAPVGAWVMRLDADEVIPPELAQELEALLPGLPDEVTGVNLKRRHIFMGKWVRHGGCYPLVLLRLWRNGCARVEDRWMDEHMVLERGRPVLAQQPFTDHNLKGLGFFTEKHHRYATREAVAVIGSRRGLFAPSPRLPSFQARLKRRLKEGLYDTVPFPFNALLYFLFRMVFQLGFLDGAEGITYHCLQGLWYRVLVGARILELERAIAGLERREDILAALARETGLPLAPG
jgi:glycosyltransferase involved in cell wall biosynthesis